MKNIIVICVLLGALLSIGIFSDYYLNRKFDQLIQIADELESQLLTHQPPTQYQVLHQTWEESKHALEMFIEHKEVKNIDTSLAALEVTLTLSDSPNSSLEKLHQLKTVFQSIPHHMKLRIENLL